MQDHLPARPSRQRGVGLIDALIAALLLALAVAAAALLQRQLRLHADEARERSAGTRLAQSHLESLLPGSVIADGVWQADAGGTRFDLAQQLVAAGPAASAVRLVLQWNGRDGQPAALQFERIVSATPPAVDAALAVRPADGSLLGPRARSVHIPLEAADLGDGRSVFKPLDDGNEAWVFEHRGGQVVARCTGIAAATPASALRATDLNTCDTTPGLLLAGTLRVSTQTPPDPAQANDVPPPLAIVALASGSERAPPLCLQQLVERGGGRWVRYHCLVHPAAGAPWSGSVAVVPAGWTLGPAPTDHRVCRHGPDRTAAMASAVRHHNLLVVRGDQPCPAGAEVILDPLPNGVYVDLGSEPHQP